MSKDDELSLAVKFLGSLWLLSVFLLFGGSLLLVGAPLAWVFGFLAGWIAVKAVVLAVFVIVAAFIGVAIVNAAP